jgi:hypothetical protein
VCACVCRYMYINIYLSIYYCLYVLQLLLAIIKMTLTARERNELAFALACPE